MYCSYAYRLYFYDYSNYKIFFFHIVGFIMPKMSLPFEIWDFCIIQLGPIRRTCIWTAQISIQLLMFNYINTLTKLVVISFFLVVKWLRLFHYKARQYCILLSQNVPVYPTTQIQVPDVQAPPFWQTILLHGSTGETENNHQEPIFQACIFHDFHITAQIL